MKTKITKLDPQIFERAAEMIMEPSLFSYQYLCNAIDHLLEPGLFSGEFTPGPSGPYKEFLRVFFKPLHPPMTGWPGARRHGTFGRNGYWGPHFIFLNQEARCLAALLCAEMIKDGIHA